MRRSDRSRSFFLVLPVFALTCAACDDGVGSGGDGLTISGSVSMPPGVDATGVEVTACIPDIETPLVSCNEVSADNQTIIIESAGTTAPFRFTNLVEKEYLIRARLDASGDDFIDYFAIDCNLGEEDTCQYFIPPIDDLDLALVPPYNDFRVRIYFPEGLNPSGIEVAFCIPDEEIDGACDPNLSSPPYSSGPSSNPDGDFWIRQIDNFPAGDYVLLAGKDTDGDDFWDFWNCHVTSASSPNCAEASPGSGVIYDIHIAETTQAPPFPYGPQPGETILRSDGPSLSTDRRHSIM